MDTGAINSMVASCYVLTNGCRAIISIAICNYLTCVAAIYFVGSREYSKIVVDSWQLFFRSQELREAMKL